MYLPPDKKSIKSHVIINFFFLLLFFVDSDLLLKKENTGKLKKIKANVINFDEGVDIQTAEEVKSDEDVMLAAGDEEATISANSYNKIVRYFKLYLLHFTILVSFVDWLFYWRI